MTLNDELSRDSIYVFRRSQCTRIGTKKFDN